MKGESTELEGSGGGALAATRTLRLDLQYDGTDFAGWQVQPLQRTVQGELERVLRAMLEEPDLDVIGSGRTDSGAHAAGQVAHVKTRSPIAVAALTRGLNSVLDRDLRVLRVSEAEPGFHARYAAVAKEYRYHFWHGEPAPPFLRRFVYAVASRLDVPAMDAAAALVVGSHDLSSFRAAHCTARSPVRTVYSARVASRGPMAVFAILGRGFLQHMVRILAGTLARVGRGQLSLEDVRKIVDARDRRVAPATAPAHGLWLVRVDYELPSGVLAATPEPMLTFEDSRS